MSTFSYSLEMFLLSCFIIALIFLWPQAHLNIDKYSRVSLRRRFAALLVDHHTILLCVLTFASILTLYIQYRSTGKWLWSFARNNEVRDLFNFSTSIIMYIALYVYLSWSFHKGKQTIGQRLLRFSLFPTANDARYFDRIKSIALILKNWMTKPLDRSTQGQDMPWDIDSSIIVRRVTRKK